MSNILFIGGAGFIGSSIIKCMLATNTSKNIYVIEPSFANVSRLDNLNVTIYRGDLSNFDFMESIIHKNKIDTIVHLVSTLIPGSGYEDYKREIQNISFPTLRLTQLCCELGIKFVYFSSGGTVYGNRQEPIPFKETDERNPISYYGLTKLMIENNILFEHRTQGLQYLIVRPSNPYGHGQALNGKQGLIAVALGKILSGGTIEIWGDGSSVRDYIYIDDLSDIINQLISREVINTIVNVGCGVGYSVNQILDITKSIVEEPVNVQYKPARSADVSTMILSTEKMNEYVDIQITPLREGIRKFYLEEKEKLK